MSTLEFNAGPTIGALQIGFIFAVFLFGAVTVQVAVYHVRFPNDPYLIKGMVALVWCLDCGHTIAICNAMYIITVVQYGHPELLAIVPDSFNLAILLSGFIGPIEQVWFAHRVYKFSKCYRLPVLCTMLSVSRACGSVALGAIALQRMPVLVFVDKWGWLIIVLLVIGALTDIILVTALCYHLSTWRGDGFVRMNHLVNRLMRWSIETGLVTSVGAMALLICFIKMPDTFNWIALSFVLSKLFSNSLLFSLNVRKSSVQPYPDRRRDSLHSLHSLHSADPLMTEFKISELPAPVSAKRRSGRRSFVSLHNSYIFPPGEGMPQLTYSDR